MEVPSPQLIVPEKSAEWLPGLASVKVALVSVAVAPSVAVTLAAAEPVSVASATVAVLVVPAAPPPASLIVTPIGSDPSSA